METPKSPTVFKVHRREPELIFPAKPTPYEFKPLSDIDDQEGLRFHILLAVVYRQDPSMQGKDPVKVIRDALAKALVFYYPFAGRLREWPNRKLVVECTSEGALFIEADADVTVEQCGHALQPPFPLLDELLFDVPGSSGIINCPLLLIQVTRFKCGGFMVGLRFNHTMIDGPGMGQFMAALGEMARGEQSPSVLPVWDREVVLCARKPPYTTCTHREYDDFTTKVPFPLDDLVQRAFFFGPSEMSALRSFVPPYLRHCTTTFEILVACLWKSRTIAFQPDHEQDMRMLCIVNSRGKFNPPIIPEGYYGNGFVLATAVATAGDVIKNPLSHALELIKRVKSETTREYVQSVADTLVIKGRPSFPMEGTYMISDLRHAGFRDMDFGWGKAIYGCPARAIPIMTSFIVPFENKKGENGYIVPICLPAQAMERFDKELKNLLRNHEIRSKLNKIKPTGRL